MRAVSRSHAARGTQQVAPSTTGLFSCPALFFQHGPRRSFHQGHGLFRFVNLSPELPDAVMIDELALVANRSHGGSILTIFSPTVQVDHGFCIERRKREVAVVVWIVETIEDEAVVLCLHDLFESLHQVVGELYVR